MSKLSSKSSEVQSCQVSCVENWVCGEWGVCDLNTNTQTRTCNDVNNCGSVVNKPIEEQICRAVCLEDWECSDWTDCVNGKQTRACIDANGCGTVVDKPVLEESCAEGGCSPTGLRQEGNYCFNDEWQLQKKENEFCENGFECGSNLCIDDKCIERGVFQTVVEFIFKLLGVEEPEIVEGCEFTRAYFTLVSGSDSVQKKVSVTGGSTVYLVVEGNEGCNGKEVVFYIKEKDLFLSEDREILTTTFANGKARVRWKPLYMPEGFGGNEEFGFTAKTNPEIDSENTLIVEGEGAPPLEGLAVGCTYVVDKGSLGGACSDTNSGIETEPWCTLDKAAQTAQAGDVVCVHAGTYTETLQPVNSGTDADNMIVFKAFPGDECQGDSSAGAQESKTGCQVIIDGEDTRVNAVYIYPQSYVRIEGFEIRNHSGGTGNDGAIEFQGAGQKIVEGIEIVNNYIYHNRGHGISALNAINSLFENNEIFDNGMSAIAFYGQYFGPGGPNNYATGLVMRGNNIHLNCQDGLKGAGQDMMIEDNRIFHQFNCECVKFKAECQASGYHSDGIEIWEAINWTVRNNIVYDTTQNIYLSGFNGQGQVIDDVDIYGNVLYNNEYQSIGKGVYIDSRGGRNSLVNDVRIHSNTIGWHDGSFSVWGVRVDDDGSAVYDNITVHNNIFYDSGMFMGIDPNVVSSDYNLFYGNYEVLANEGPNSIYDQGPQFVDYTGQGSTGFDFHLLPTSPAIDNGDPLLGDLFNLPSPFLDIDGVVRPQGLGWDIGAYEFTGGAPAGTNAIAVWDFNDKFPMSGTVHVGVAAFHETGINRVEFTLDGSPYQTVVDELINPDTGYPGFDLTIDTTAMTDGDYLLEAVAYPNTGNVRSLTGDAVP